MITANNDKTLKYFFIVLILIIGGFFLGFFLFNNRYRFMYFDIIRYLPFRFNCIAMNSFDATIKDSKLKEQYTWFDDPMADSLVPKNVHMKFRSALHMMKAVNHHWPNFHKKSYRLTYQTSCSYTGKQGTNLYTGFVRFLDTNHSWVPKLGRIRVAGSQGRMLDLKYLHLSHTVFSAFNKVSFQ